MCDDVNRIKLRSLPDLVLLFCAEDWNDFWRGWKDLNEDVSLEVV